MKTIEIVFIVGSVILSLSIIIAGYRVSKLKWYYPEKETPKGTDIKNSIDVVIKNLKSEKEILGYYDVVQSRYYGFDGSLIDYKFIWRYNKNRDYGKNNI